MWKKPQRINILDQLWVVCLPACILLITLTWQKIGRTFQMFYSSVWAVLDTNYSWDRSQKSTFPTLASGCGCTAWGCLCLALLSGIFTLLLDLSKDWGLASTWDPFFLGNEWSVSEWAYKNKTTPESAAGLEYWDIFPMCLGCPKICFGGENIWISGKGKNKNLWIFQNEKSPAIQVQCTVVELQQGGETVYKQSSIQAGVQNMILWCRSKLPQVEVIAESRFPFWWVF